jgi:O-antigen/teichoic acid export membrane protein
MAVSAALFVTPMTVIVSQAGEQSEAQLQSIVDIIRCFLLSVFVVVTIVGNLWDGWQLALALGIFFCGGLALDIGRRIDYLNRQWSKDLAGSVSVFVMTLCGLWWINRSGLMSLPFAISVIGGAQITWVFLSSGRIWFRGRFVGNFHILNELWRRGQWGLAAAGASYGYMQASTFIVFVMVGSTGVALIEISRQLMMPIQIYMTGMANAFHPRISKKCLGELNVLLPTIFRITALQFGIGIILVVVIVLFAEQILQLFVGEKFSSYEDAVPFVVIWGAIMLTQMAWQHASFGLYSLSKFKSFFLNRFIPMVIIMPITWWATLLWSEAGALWARCLAEIMVVCGSWYYLQQKTLVTSRYE